LYHCTILPPNVNPYVSRRLTCFLFGLFAITYLVSGATVVPNAWIAQELKLGHVSRVSRRWNAGVAPEVSAAFLAALEK
jgi:hypothetical protein